MAIRKTTITNFNGGKSKDIRQNSYNSFAISQHFDIFSKPKRLIPYPKTEADETVGGTPKDGDIVKFIYAPLSTGYRLFGYGTKLTGTTEAGIFLHDADLTATGWTSAANGEGTTTGRNEDVFFHYKNYLYNWAGGTKLQRYGDLTSSPTFTDSYQAITYTTVAQPVHHPADDIAYFFSDNKVHSLNDTTWTSNVLVLPDNMNIVSATDYGNYLAIGCAPKDSIGGESIIYFWDRDSSLTTISSKISLGKGELKHIATLNGSLVAVINFFMGDANGLRQGKMIIKKVIGSQAFTINEILADTPIATAIYNTMAVKEDKLYFPADIQYKGETMIGIWVVDENGKITIDTVEEEVSASISFQGIYPIGNVWWIAHSNDGSINRSDDNLSYSYTSIYESQIFNFGDSSEFKKLIGVTAMTEPLPTGGQLVLKYRIDDDIEGGSWTTIFTENNSEGTNPSISKSGVKDSTGANLKEFKEVQFRLESTGQAIPTGLKFKTEDISRDIY